MLRNVGFAVLIAVLAFSAALVGINMMRSTQPPPREQVPGQTENDKSAEEADKHQEPKVISWTDLWRRTVNDPVSFFTLMLAIFSAGLLAVAGLQIWLLVRAENVSRITANAAKDAANAATESNKISRAAMIADQRPWISLDVEIGGLLAYDAQGWDAGIRWHIALKYRLQHLGKTPATNVSFFGEIIPFVLPYLPDQGLPVSGTDIAKEFERVCNFPETMTASNVGWGKIMFPNENPESRTFGMNGNPALFDAVKNAPIGYSGQFLVVVCATYGSTLNADKYRTAKAFQLFKKSGTGNIDLNGETIAQGDLGFVLSPTNGSYAR
jgi:hypothetical protein